MLDELEEARRLFPEIRLAGLPYYYAVNERVLKSEFGLLLLAAAIVLLIVELIVLRGSIGPAFLLWAFSLLPTLFLLGLFAALKTPLRIQYVFAPVITLSLSNSYITHIYRAWAAYGFDPRAAIRGRGSIIAMDAGTTALGLGSLFFSPVKELSILGAFSIAGAALSLLVGLVGLPAALGLVRRPSPAAIRFAASEDRLTAPPARKAARIALWLAAAVFLGFFSTRLQAGLKPIDLAPPWSFHAEEAAYFESAYSGLFNITLVLNTKRENGLVDMETYRAINALERDIAALPLVGDVYGPTDLIAEALARYEGSSLAKEEPRDEADIGETLQLLSGMSDGLFSRGFVDSAWASAKINISVSPVFNNYTDFPTLKAAVESAINERLPEVDSLWAGEAVIDSISQRAFIKGQVSGGVWFFVFLFIGLCLVFRSVKRAFAVMIVPATGFLATLGLMGLVGWDISPVHAIALATVAGTGVDNAINLVFRGWTTEVRAAIIDTTLLIALSMAVLLACSSFLPHRKRNMHRCMSCRY